MADDAGRTCTSRSRTRSAGVFREYERLATTVVDAALSPLLVALPRPARGAHRRGGPARARGDALQRRRRRAPRPPPRHGSWTVLSGPAGGAVAAGARGRRGRRRGPRHGRHVVRRVAGARRPRGRDRRARGGRPLAGAADGGRAHGGRGRRQHRLARRGRRAEGRAAIRGRRARARVLRPRRRGADRDRRQPAARPPRRRRSRWRAACELDRAAAERAVGGLAERARAVASRRPPRGSCAWRTPRWRRPCGW